MAFRLTSASFDDGSPIPSRHTCDGDDLSPALAWTAPPPGTQSLALLCEDPDAPCGVFRHWSVFDIPADRRDLKEGVAPAASTPDGLRQSLNDFKRPGYAGPCPPKGHGVHHYRFRLLALGTARLDAGTGSTCADIARLAAPHVLAEADLTGLFERR